MLLRFSLYGFLKNQKYYEPFFILALQEKGLSFFAIGLLIGFRQVCINLFEIPSGFMADHYGRRRTMMASFGAYILSFLIFAVSSYHWSLYAAMLFFSLGEAFRTGTHKAMIFDWLTVQNKAHERIRYYGYTRSWSQMGSAVSVVLAALAVILRGDYRIVFWLSIIPCLLNLINLGSYPAFLDGRKDRSLSGWAVLKQAGRVLRESWKPLRGLLAESMVFKGSYTVAKAYLQPLLKQAALALPLLLEWKEQSRSTLLIGLVFFLLYFLSGLASRNAHWFALRFQGTAAWKLWLLSTLAFAGLIPALLFQQYGGAVVLFILLAVLQNIGRPLFLGRIDEKNTVPEMGATILSIESQAASLFVMIFAPLLGLAVDNWGLWPLGILGLGGLFWLIPSSKKEDS